MLKAPAKPEPLRDAMNKPDTNSPASSQTGARSGLWWLWVSALVVALDQWSKALASEKLELYVGKPVTSWFNWTLMHNEGMAFSFLADQSGWQRWFLSALAIAIVLWLMRWLKQTSFHFRLLNIGLALIIGGAIGNTIDRLGKGYVVDFIEWHYQTWYWPAFNVADMAITLGAVLLVLDALFGQHPDKPADTDNTPA